MLILGSNLKNLPVMSLQTGGQLALAREPVVNPNNLQVVAYRVEGPLLAGTQTYLRTDDARELSDIGFIIDSIDDFVAYADVIKLREVIDLHFQLDGIKVIDEHQHMLGRVSDYTIDISNFTIQQLTIKRPLLQRFHDTELLIHRSHITNITDDTIVIHSNTEMPEHTALSTPGSYVNPFRRPAPGAAAESIDAAQR